MCDSGSNVSSAADTVRNPVEGLVDPTERDLGEHMDLEGLAELARVEARIAQAPLDQQHLLLGREAAAARRARCCGLRFASRRRRALLLSRCRSRITLLAVEGFLRHVLEI